MILGIVELRRVVDEELERRGVGIVLNVGIGAEHLRGIQAVLVGIHHLGQARLERHAHTHVGIDAGGHRVAALGLDENDAVAAFGSVECGGILQHGDLLYVLGVDVEQEVVIVAIVQRRTGFLHVAHNAVDHDERLGIGRERVQTAHKHSSTIAGAAGTGDGSHVGTQLSFHIGLNSLRGGVGNLGRGRSEDIGTVLVHLAKLVGNHLHLQLVAVGSYAYLLAQELRGMEIECRGEGGHLDDKVARLVGHCRIVVVAQRLDHDTGKR